MGPVCWRVNLVDGWPERSRLPTNGTCNLIEAQIVQATSGGLASPCLRPSSASAAPQRASGSSRTHERCLQRSPSFLPTKKILRSAAQGSGAGCGLTPIGEPPQEALRSIHVSGCRATGKQVDFESVSTNLCWVVNAVKLSCCQDWVRSPALLVVRLTAIV
jgi:hypothetical protein